MSRPSVISRARRNRKSSLFSAGARRATGRATYRRPVFEMLEAKRVMTTYTLDTPEESATINAAIFQAFKGNSAAGTGLIDSFLRIQKNGTEQGFNTDANSQLDNKSGTRALLLSEIPLVKIGNTLYREFVLDTNESDPLISIEKLEIYLTNSNNLANYNSGTQSFGLPGGNVTTLIYSMDAGDATNTVIIDDSLSGGGSGKLDMLLLVPDALFANPPNPAYVTLYTQMGLVDMTPPDTSSDSGFEEWAVGKGRTVTSTIKGYKFNDLNNNGMDDGEARLAGVTIYLDADNDDNFDPGEVSTVTDAMGLYSFEGLFAGEYRVREVAPVGSTQTTPNPGPITVVLGKTYIAAGIATGVTSEVVTANLAFGNFTFVPGKISGVKFNDTNGNSTKDGGEAVLSGWTIYIDTDGSNTLNGTEVSTTTNGSGFYEFTGLTAGSYTIREVAQSGWTQTSLPEEHVIAVSSGTNSQNNNFGNFQKGVISGYKWNDLDGDGEWDDNEDPIEGWKIFLDDGESIIDTATTDANGYYEFDELMANTYTVTEETQTGWKRTSTPASYIITVLSGTNDEDNNFGNFKLGVISGYKWNDLNGDGVWQTESEPARNKWKLYLEDSEGNIVETINGDDGYYEFSGLMAGQYTVTEETKTGWKQTGLLDENGDVITQYVIDVTSGTDDEDNNFGNFQLGIISGYKFVDKNGDGEWQDNESPKSGWKIFLEDEEGNIFDTITGADGYYEFGNLMAGEYTVTEETQTGWKRTTDDESYVIDVTSGTNDQDNNFGNFQLGKISGYKWEDTDGDGLWDDNEDGLAGWTIYLNDGETTDQTTTNDDGYYEFKNLMADTYTVTEESREGWKQTGPISEGVVTQYTVTVITGTNDENNNFGNFECGTICGTKWEDVNGNGVRETGDNGLQGWEIQLYVFSEDAFDFVYVRSEFTGEKGEYCFKDLGPGDYYVREEPQTGWKQTGPLGDGVIRSYSVQVVSGTKKEGADFGNFECATICGIKFEDCDGDGVQDENEHGIEGWKFYLDTDGSGGISEGDLVTYTDENGCYCFEELGPGTYTVYEQEREGWTKTAGGATITVESGKHYVSSLDVCCDCDEEVGPSEVEEETPTEEDRTVVPGLAFGNFKNVVIRGYKFHDKDSDGIDDDEPRLQGWKIYIDANGNKKFDTGETFDITDANGEYEFTDLGPGTYKIREELQVGWFQTTGGACITVCSGGTYDACQERAESEENGEYPENCCGEYVCVPGLAFGNNEVQKFDFSKIIVISSDAGANAPPHVQVINKMTGQTLVKFLAYEKTYRAGVRIAVGDMTGDGVPEIITAPGRLHANQIRVFTLAGVELTAFRTTVYTTAEVNGGVQLAIGDVDGDGDNDLAVVPTRGKAEVRIFKNTFQANLATANPNDSLVDPMANTAWRKFLAFPATFIGGATIGVADMGKFSGSTVVSASLPDGKAEVIVGNGSGMRSTIKIFNVQPTTPTVVRTILPFSSTFRGGVFFDLARINNDLIPDLVIGAGHSGNSNVEVRNGRTGGLIKAFQAYDDVSNEAPVRVALLDTDNNGIADKIVTVQGTDGKTREIRCFDTLSGAQVDSIMESDIDFFGEYFIGVSGLSSKKPLQPS